MAKPKIAAPPARVTLPARVHEPPRSDRDLGQRAADALKKARRLSEVFAKVAELLVDEELSPDELEFQLGRIEAVWSAAYGRKADQLRSLAVLDALALARKDEVLDDAGVAWQIVAYVNEWHPDTAARLADLDQALLVETVKIWRTGSYNARWDAALGLLRAAGLNPPSRDSLQRYWRDWHPGDYA